MYQENRLLVANRLYEFKLEANSVCLLIYSGKLNILEINS